MRLLVTGASGKLGAKVLDALTETHDPADISVLVRTPAQSEALAARGFDVRHGDYDRPETLVTAFTGIDRLLLISASSFDDDTRIRQHSAVVDAAKEAGVGFIAYTSLPHADTTPMSVAVVHKAAEEAIVASGIPYSFLRNNWYLENEIDEVDNVQRAIAGHPIVTSAGDGRTSWVLREEFGRAAAAVLASDGHQNTVYELSGPPTTYDQFAEALSVAIGRPVEVRHVDDAEFAAELERRGTPWADLLVDFQQELRDGLLDVTSDDLETLLGRKPTPLHEGLAKLIEEHDLV